MKKILFIAPCILRGGMEQQFFVLIENLHTTEYALELALFRNYREFEVPSYLKIIDLKKKGKIDFLFIIRLFLLIRNGNYHIIHSKISGPNEYVMFLAGLLKRKNIILELRSGGELLHKEYKKMKLLFSLFKSDKWKIICNSKKTMREIKQILPRHTAVYYIGNGIDITKFSNNKSNANSQEISIGFIGRIEPVKNLECLIRAMALFSKSEQMLNAEGKLKLIGPQKNQRYKYALDKLIEELGLKKIVQFSQAFRNIEDYYNQLYLFVLPSYAEGTANSLLEAMACERVCLVSQGADSDGIIESRFHFDQNNPNELAQKITMAMHLTKDEYEETGSSNRMKILQDYSIDSLVNKYLALWSDF